VRNARIVPTDALELPRGAQDLDAGKLIAQALADRPDLLQAGLQAANTRITLEGSRNALKPQLDLTAFAENTGLAGARSPFALNPDTTFLGGYGSALAQVLQRDYPIYGAGIQLNLPLRNRVAQADAARDEIASRQAEVRLEQFRNQARLEVQDAVIALAARRHPMRRGRGGAPADGVAGSREGALRGGPGHGLQRESIPERVVAGQADGAGRARFLRQGQGRAAAGDRRNPGGVRALRRRRAAR